MPMNRWRMLGVLLTASLLAPVGSQTGGAAELPGQVLSSETDQPAVVEFLRRIIDGRNKADARAKNLLLKGRTSLVTLKWKAGMEPRNPARMPAPVWRNFTLVQRGAKRRYEQEYVQQVGEKQVPMTVYRLADGKSFYKLDGNAFEILGNKEGEKRWEELAYDYYNFGQVHDGVSYGTLVDVCQKLIDRMTKGLEQEYWQHQVLRCSEEGGVLLVDNDDKAVGKSRCRFRFWVDPGRGYRVVKVFSQMGGPSQGLDYREESQIEPQKVIPGVYIDRKGTTFVADLGTVAKRDNRAGWLKRDMEVTEVTVEDFEYDDKLFDWHTLPVPIGAHVTDHRSDPELLFNHGVEPLDEEILRANLRIHPSSWIGRHRWLLLANAAVLCIFAAFFLVRRWRVRKAAR